MNALLVHHGVILVGCCEKTEFICFLNTFMVFALSFIPYPLLCTPASKQICIQLNLCLVENPVSLKNRYIP